MTAETQRQCADDPRATFPHLSIDQLAGYECPLCFRRDPDVPIPHLGINVFACGTPPRAGSEPCAVQLGFRPEDGWQGARQ